MANACQDYICKITSRQILVAIPANSPTNIETMNPKHKTTAQMQAELDLMRVMYARRQSLNQPRRDRMIGWVMVLLATIFVSAVTILIISTIR